MLVFVLTRKAFGGIHGVAQIGIGLPVIGRHFSRVVRALGQHTQAAFEQNVRVGQRAVELIATAQVDAASPDLAGDLLAWSVETRAGTDIHVARYCITCHRRHNRLLYHDLLGDCRGNIVKT